MTSAIRWATRPVAVLRRFASFRARSMTGFFLALAIMLGGAVDASACASEAIDTVPTIVASHGDQGSTDDRQVDGHATCAHGHCHHTGPFAVNGGDGDEVVRVATLKWALAQQYLRALTQEIPTDPPRA